MLETGPDSCPRPSSMGSISSRYHSTPEIVRSTDSIDCAHGLPISHTSSSASRSRCSSSASTARRVRAWRSDSGTEAQSACSATVALSASAAMAGGSMEGPTMLDPSMGDTAAWGLPASRHVPPQRLRRYPSAKASGATARARS